MVETYPKTNAFGLGEKADVHSEGIVKTSYAECDISRIENIQGGNKRDQPSRSSFRKSKKNLRARRKKTPTNLELLKKTSGDKPPATIRDLAEYIKVERKAEGLGHGSSISRWRQSGGLAENHEKTLTELLKGEDRIGDPKGDRVMKRN